jgi:hypothetical protein
MVGMNPIAAKNNTVVTLHLDDEECGSERLAPYGELHGTNTPSLHQVAPHPFKHKVSLHELVVLPSKLLKDGVRHQVNGSTPINEHPGDWLPIDVSPGCTMVSSAGSTLRASQTWPPWG